MAWSRLVVGPFKRVKAEQTADQARARFGGKLADDFPSSRCEIVTGDRSVYPVAQPPQLQQRLVVHADGFFDPPHQRARRQVTHACAVEAIGDDAVLFRSRQPAQACLA